MYTITFIINKYIYNDIYNEHIVYTYHTYMYTYIRSPVALTFFHASYALRELLCTDFSKDGSHKRR